MISYNNITQAITITKGNTGDIKVTFKNEPELSNYATFSFIVRNILNPEDIKFQIDSLEITEEKYSGNYEYADGVLIFHLTSAATSNLNRGKYTYEIKLDDVVNGINTFIGGGAQKNLFIVT